MDTPITQRRILKPVLDDLGQKMVLIAGPRQCGKTTMVKSLLRNNDASYYSWDIIKCEFSPDSNPRYFLERTKIEHAFQISLHGTKDFEVPSINGCQVRVLPAYRFLANLP